LNGFSRRDNTTKESLLNALKTHNIVTMNVALTRFQKSLNELF